VLEFSLCVPAWLAGWLTVGRAVWTLEARFHVSLLGVIRPGLLDTVPTTGISLDAVPDFLFPIFSPSGSGRWGQMVLAGNFLNFFNT
jgi:hypothetical protein